MPLNAVEFAHELAFRDLPAAVVAQARRAILDLAGVAAAGAATGLSLIARDFAVNHLGGAGKSARMLFDGRRASPAGAAFAGASGIDSFDAHDGHALTKGHAGVAILPSILAVMDAECRGNGRELITALVVGYEVATRAGMALHATACDYHTSGAWNALGSALVAARLIGLDRQHTREAAGIAEYHGPRSQMMRCIDHPTMVKDGSGWGALAGVSAAYLAAAGFTGAPALLLEEGGVGGLWDDLGTRWRILEQYFKPYPVCRWAQPAIEAARQLQAAHDFAPQAIEHILVETFAEAARLAGARPRSTEEAQYALAFPLAAMLVRGRLAGSEIGGTALGDPVILDLSARVSLAVEPDFAARFPAERLARVTLTLNDGRALVSPPTPARGDPAAPLSEAEMLDKFETLAEALSPDRRDRLGRLIGALGAEDDAQELIAVLTRPI